MLGILLTLALAVPAPQGDQNAPPGLVLVKGGKTKIGTEVDTVEDMVIAREELKTVLIGETPRHTVDVEDFYLMPTEVTNEQYAEYVKASGSKPPRSWGTKALQAGQAAFLEEQGKAKLEARKAGKPFETQTFDPEKWWEENWKDAEWEIPDQDLTHPVVFVTYREAEAYARWAGLRLMTEVEYQRAARGDSERTYPWGDDWDDRKYCQSLMIGKDASAPVGSYPDGAVNGLYDLAGNVWEWTSSPYTPYPGYEAQVFKVKKRRIECMAPWDPNERVLVSGSFQMDPVGVRVATRMWSTRNQATSALGFRCASSVKPGLDAARRIINNDLNKATLGVDVEIPPEFATTLRYWNSAPGTAKIENYAVITGYEHLLCVPTSDLRASSPKNLATLTEKDGPVFIGVVDVPRPMLEPELDAGTFMVFWRGAGKLRLPEETEEEGEDSLRVGGQEEIPFHKVLGFDEEKDMYFFYSREGVPQVAIEAPPVEIDKMAESTIAIEPFVAPDPKTLPKGTPPPAPIDTLRFTLMVPSTSRSKGFKFDLPLKVSTGTYSKEQWK